ncbi:uncharacterized protein B0H18DRAFT_1113903 [Fomitopsis serialis]|uniref:uncharacterized protein n=1 Tax=Fomitopsis serialis TaxID=139415 RepID=UPI002007E336|nr:uncharacterized protein B0H18DRAFT_1113903 [Neoantrodia serialis]KAH9936520.1 hypothetical protein B0H18DRAFT_1113903 [Neoantrodia serialis]
MMVTVEGIRHKVRESLRPGWSYIFTLRDSIPSRSVNTVNLSFHDFHIDAPANPTVIMRFTTSLFAVVTLFCVLLLVQAVPVEPRDDAEVCGKITDCDDCVKKNICGFTFNTHQCVARSAHTGGTLATNAAQCKSIGKQPAHGGGGASNTVSRADAEKIWKGMESHVFDGNGDKPGSGRHLTSTWLKRNPKSAADMVINPQTSLATVPFGMDGRKTKTLFIDGKVTGLVNNKQQAFTGRYTRDIVEQMCTDAIEKSLEENKSKTAMLAGDNSYAVKSFDGGPTVSVAVNRNSCFPQLITPTTRQPGEKC